MSLEQALIDNTAAINNLAALLQNTNTVAGNPVPPGPEDVKTAEPKKPAAKKAAPKKEEPLPPPPAEEAAPAIQYEQVSEAILAYNQKNGREKTIELLSSFGVSKGPELKPEQYEEFLAAATAAGEDDLT